MATGDLSVARRYATALFNVAEKRDEVDDVVANLNTVLAAFSSSRELQSVLHHPRITREKKKSVLHAIFGGEVRADVEQFLFLVVEKERAVLLPEIHREFKRLVDEHRKESDAEAVSAVALTPEQVQSLETSLEQRFGVKVRLKTRVDESLLGGLVVRVGDKLIDGSVVTRLQSFSEHLKRAKVA